VTGDRTTASNGKRGEPLLELLEHLAAEPELDRAGAPDRPVRQPPRDEHSLCPPLA
jgi:hypothetical protein